MARFNQWTQLLKASATSHRHDEKSDGVKQERYLLLDTAMGSENSGDHVIMDACGGLNLWRCVAPCGNALLFQRA